jgi:hypothetical protein
VQALPLIYILIFSFCTERIHASAPEMVHRLVAAATNLLHEAQWRRPVQAHRRLPPGARRRPPARAFGLAAARDQRRPQSGTRRAQGH